MLSHIKIQSRKIWRPWKFRTPIVQHNRHLLINQSSDCQQLKKHWISQTKYSSIWKLSKENNNRKKGRDRCDVLQFYTKTHRQSFAIGAWSVTNNLEFKQKRSFISQIGRLHAQLWQLMKLKCQDRGLNKPLKQSNLSEKNLMSLFKELRKLAKEGSNPLSDASTFIISMKISLR